MEYTRPDGITADIVVVNPKNEILLIERKHDPYQGWLALPGGFVEPNEEIIATAKRELFEETGLSIPKDQLRLLGVYSEPGRDPRGWIVSVCYYFITQHRFIPKAKDDAVSAEWMSLSILDHKRLAFDHADMIHDFLCR